MTSLLKIFYSDHHPVPVPHRHPFPAGKYARLHHRILRDPISHLVDLQAASPADTEQLALAHDPDYLDRVAGGELSSRELRRLGFPWSRDLYLRSLHSVGGTISACRSALTDGISINLGGGTHHASRAAGAGFCMLNDTVVAARDAQRSGAVRRVVVLDCDVHQGDGTAELVADDDSVFSLSIHGASNFPLRKKTSDLDVPLASGTNDHQYLTALEPAVQTALDRARADLAIYLAGADPFHDDRYGRLALTKDGLAQRDRLVLESCRIRGLPVAVTLAGGYARNVDDIVDIHLATVKTAVEILNS
jgi:acetoin utilization deacetylase AcuC-like enzyme